MSFQNHFVYTAQMWSPDSDRKLVIYEPDVKDLEVQKGKLREGIKTYYPSKKITIEENQGSFKLLVFADGRWIAFIQSTFVDKPPRRQPWQEWGDGHPEDHGQH